MENRTNNHVKFVVGKLYQRRWDCHIYLPTRDYIFMPEGSVVMYLGEKDKFSVKVLWGDIIGFMLKIDLKECQKP